ncbi:hypothetical protein AVEN_137431-1 [Araneus ventricosus]|uniref:DDE-1 domain-containing protein n=1 Tax=Araneus ventricosus TaxID=182803 RepID=A0A4Y2NX92_ARAVE|nr:hypothetical protein AVEN_137431-1 [Araneus ventricosus]
MDETGISTVPNRTQKEITPKGKETVCKVSSAERGQTVTEVCCLSATGVFVPPALILPLKRMIPLLYKDASNGTLSLISDTEDPVLLIADNHTSHCSLPAVLFCREIHITFLTPPPHASHVLQPLDTCFFALLKALYSSETDKWLVQNPGKSITLYKVSVIFQKAYSAASRVQLAEKAFRVTGIEPNNPDIISEDCYSPSLVTLAPLDKDCTVAVAPEENEVSPSTSHIIVSIQSTCQFLDMNNEELNGKENFENLRS